MDDKEWLERATKFDLGTCMFYERPISIEARDQINGDRLWVFKMQEWVLGKDGEFYWEPMPSSRTKKFIELTRFKTPDECHSFWKKSVTHKEDLTVDYC